MASFIPDDLLIEASAPSSLATEDSEGAIYSMPRSYFFLFFYLLIRFVTTEVTSLLQVG